MVPLILLKLVCWLSHHFPSRHRGAPYIQEILPLGEDGEKRASTPFSPFSSLGDKAEIPGAEVTKVAYKAYLGERDLTRFTFLWFLKSSFIQSELSVTFYHGNWGQNWGPEWACVGFWPMGHSAFKPTGGDGGECHLGWHKFLLLPQRPTFPFFSFQFKS